MSIQALMDRIPGFAKDVRLNLSTMAGDETLGAQTKYGLFLAAAIAARNPDVVAAFEAEAAARISPAAIAAAKAAASIMAMNNVYYRFLHLASNQEYRTMRAGLRMNVVASPGVEKTDFELWSLAVSAINGCGACIDAHEKVLFGANVPASAIQTAVRYAAIIQSVAVALEAGAAGPAHGRGAAAGTTA